MKSSIAATPARGPRKGTAWLAGFRAEREQDWEQAAGAQGRLISWCEEDGEPYAGALMESRLSRGIAHLKRREFHAAIRDFTLAGRLSGSFLEPSILLGKAYYLAGLREEAEKVFCELHHALPAESREEVATWIVAVYASAHDCENSMRWAERTRGGLRHRVEGFLEYFRWNYGAAAAALKRAIDIDPEDAGAWYGLGYSLLETAGGRAGLEAERARREITNAAERAYRLAPDDALYICLLASARLEEGRLEEAERLARSAFRGFHEEVAWVTYSLIKLAQEDLAEAERGARRAVERNPMVRYTHQALGRVLEAERRHAEAAEAYRRSIEAEPGRSTPYGLLAGCLDELGQHDEAVAECEKALDMLPVSSPVHENLTLALWRLGRREEAIAALERGLRLVPDRKRLCELRQLIATE